MKSLENEEVLQIPGVPESIGPISIDSIKNSKFVFTELSNLKNELINIVNKKKKGFGKKTRGLALQVPVGSKSLENFCFPFQIGVYLIYIESEKVLYIGATKDFQSRVGNHKAAFNSARGHINNGLQECYNKIKQKKNLSHQQILDNYFKFIPLCCYQISCSDKEVAPRSTIDFIVQTLEPKVKKAFENTGKFNIVNIGAMLDQNLSNFQSTSISLKKQNYYNKLANLVAAEVLLSEKKNVPFNLNDLSSFTGEEQKSLKNASRKIRPVVSMELGKYFPSFDAVCDSNLFNIKNTDTISQYARKDSPTLDKRNLRFASNQEILAQKYIPDYNSVVNPGVFNNETTTFSKKKGVIGPKFPKQENLSNEKYSKIIKETCFSCTAQKSFYESKIDASFLAKVSDKAISKWIARDNSLQEEFNMPIIWRNATQEENQIKRHISQARDIVPLDYNFDLERTTRIQTDSSTLAAKAKKGYIVPEKQTKKPKFISSFKEAQDYCGFKPDELKIKIRDAEIEFLNKETPRLYRTASLEENTCQSYIKKYDTFSLEKILEGLPKVKYKIDANIANFKID